ncbi:calmodulin-regulated spectrin-associated protein 1-like isoform X2 [Acanthaster planci]|uniref:Calmodulin-regulated spectrin-associated protein 1-like isoform X2 n=1 Tax=Acanthaster planci TaxID=133434 RepID=A0A8B7YD32_ACAPL|nr:calmodulin-regulated spectrin-associated protein 1-like isoform X2 [Acanthaster planci]
MALNHRDNSRARSLSSSSASSYHSLDRGSSLTSEIMPIGQYNSKKAKLCASIRWLVSKAYSSSTIPPDIRNPFFKDKEGEDHLRPAVIYQLSSGELYSRACANIFPPSLHQWQGHWSVIQGLSRRGIYVVDDRRQPVTEAVLTQTQRIKLNAHLAVMDSIMTAYTGEVVSIEKIVQAVRRITTFNASSELPFDLENALVFWVNKVCVAARHRMERERRSQQEQAMQTQAQKVRIKRQHLQLKEMPGVPIIKNVTKDISDGRSLCLLIHYYCPQHFSLDDVDLHDTMSFADSVNNLQQVENFLEQHLPETHHFTFEDLLYSPEALRVNILALTAELFYWFEVARPPRLGFSQELGQKFPVTPESGRSRVQQLPPLPISSATKKSFHGDAPSPRSELRSAASNPEVNRITSASPQRTQSLLVHRERKPRNALHAEQGEDGPSNLRRASSLENMEARESFLAWQSREEARDRSQTFGTPSPGSAPASTVRDSNTNNLLAKVSIDSDMNDSHNFSELGGMPNLNGQLSKEGNDSGEGLMSSSAHFENEDDLEVESLTSALSRISQQTEKPVSCSYSEEVQLPSRSPGGENGISADQELTNVTPLSSMSSRPSQSLNSETGRMDLLDQTRDRIGQSRTNGSGEFGHPEAIEPETDMRAVTQSRRRLKLDIEPVDTKQTERLLPAVVRPLKEKSRNVNKKEESGEGRRIARNPREDRSGRSPNPNGSNMTTWSRKQSAGGDGESPESIDATTPLSGESIADSLAGDGALQLQQQHRLAWQKPRPGVAQHQADPTSYTTSHLCQPEEPHVAHARHGEAFFIHSHAQPEQSVGNSSLSRTGTGSSFTIADKKYTVASALEAGIPVVSSLVDLQDSEEPASYDNRASPRHPSAHPSLHAAPSHSPVSAWHPTEILSGNPHPNPSPNLHAQPNPHVRPNPHAQPNPHARPNLPPHETAINRNAGHSGDDRPGLTHAESPQGHSNTGMDTGSHNTPSSHPQSPEKESSKLHAELIQRESTADPRKPVLMTFNSNLSPDEKSSLKQFIIPPTSTQVISSDQDSDLDHKPSSSSLTTSQEHKDLKGCEKLEAELAHKTHPMDTERTDIESSPKLAIDPDSSSLIMHSNPYLSPPTTQPTMVDHSCIPLESTSSYPESQVLTTWGANSKQTPLSGIINTGGGNLTQSGSLAAGDLAQIRSRLEEKRRLMDSDKRKLERHWSKQRQRMGKAAFLQVLANQKRVKDPVAGDQPVGTEDDRSMIGEKTRSQDVYSREELERSIEKSRTQWASNQAQQEGKITFADLGSSKEKQLSNWSVADSPRSQRPTASSQLADRPESPPGISEVAAGKGSPGSSSGSHSPHMTSDEYNTSLEKLNANLSQLQNEIQRLSLQQEQMRSVMESPRPPSERSQSPQHAPPADSKPFILHAGSDPPATSQGFFLSSDTNKEPESFVLHENPVYEMSGADMQMHSPRPVGPVQKLAPEVGQGSITRPVEQPKIPKSPYPANQVPSSSPDNTYIIPPAQTPVKNIVSETPKNEVPQNITHVVASTPANEPPRNADALANQHQPPLPTVASLSNHMAQMSNKEQSLASPVEAVEVVKRPKKNREATSPTRKKRSSLYEIVGEGEDDDENLSEDEHLVVRPLDSTGNSSLDAKTKAKGFVIASETDQLDEVERRKMLFLQNRLKKQEEEKAKRASREADMEKKREQNRRKQEEMEAKKAEERARREQIRLEYQRRKLQEQQENEPAPARRAKPTKPRPKSTVVEDQTDFGRPATSRYAPDRDLDNYSAPKKSFTVSAPSSGGGSGAESQVKVPPVDGPEQAAEKPGPPASPKQQGVCPEASEAATPAKSPATESKTENKLAERPLVAKQPPVAKQQPSPQSPKAKEPPCLTPPLQKENQLQVKGQLEEVAGGSSAASVVSQDSNGSGGGGGHTTPEYQGPKLYVKPTSKSNRHIITNAISHCVLAGTVNREQKDKVLEELAKAEAKHFIILFRDSQLQFRSLYGYSPDSEELTKLYGVGPRHITHKMYENLYKYNSGSKQFSKIPSKTMSVSVDGLTIGASYWLSKKGPSKKK